MSCNCCQQTKPIANCVTTIVIGTISNLSTAVYVYFKNKSTDKVFRFSATSSGAGVVSITVGSQKFTNNHAYECWVTLASATNLEDKLPVTISGMTGTFTCFLVPFYHIQDNSNAPVSYSSQTLVYDVDYPCYDNGVAEDCCITKAYGSFYLSATTFSFKNTYQYINWSGSNAKLNVTHTDGQSGITINEAGRYKVSGTIRIKYKIEGI